ncbi:MAG: hypothetical protein KC550_02895 [Nanoarchaeota archaeon]|nr:hypothetical protein [Nanoarchaeota archaeon]
MTQKEDYTYYYFLEEIEKHGAKIASAYLKYQKENPIEENQSLEKRMAYLQGFCNVMGLKHPETFFEIENAKEKKIHGELLRGAAVRIMTRGASVCLPSDLRKTIEDKLKNE